MNPAPPRDQQGIGMIFELILVAVVLSLVGLAVYQASTRPKAPASSQSTSAPSPSTVVGLAATAATLIEQEATVESTINEAAQSSLDTAILDDDIADLGESFNEDNF